MAETTPRPDGAFLTPSEQRSEAAIPPKSRPNEERKKMQTNEKMNFYRNLLEQACAKLIYEIIYKMLIGLLLLSVFQLTSL